MTQKVTCMQVYRVAQSHVSIHVKYKQIPNCSQEHINTNITTLYTFVVKANDHYRKLKNHHGTLNNSTKFLIIQVIAEPILHH